MLVIFLIFADLQTIVKVFTLLNSNALELQSKMSLMFFHNTQVCRYELYE